MENKNVDTFYLSGVVMRLLALSAARGENDHDKKMIVLCRRFAVEDLKECYRKLAEKAKYN